MLALLFNFWESRLSDFPHFIVPSDALLTSPLHPSPSLCVSPLSLSVSLSLSIPTWTGRRRPTQRLRPPSSSSSSVLPHLPLTSVSPSPSSLSLPFPPEAVVGARRRRLPGDDALAGALPAREGLGGLLSLPHPSCGLNASSHWGACAALLDETLGLCASAEIGFLAGGDSDGRAQWLDVLVTDPVLLC